MSLNFIIIGLRTLIGSFKLSNRQGRVYRRDRLCCCGIDCKDIDPQENPYNMIYCLTRIHEKRLLVPDQNTFT